MKETWTRLLGRKGRRSWLFKLAALLLFVLFYLYPLKWMRAEIASLTLSPLTSVQENYLESFGIEGHRVSLSYAYGDSIRKDSIRTVFGSFFFISMSALILMGAGRKYFRILILLQIGLSALVVLFLYLAALQSPAFMEGCILIKQYLKPMLTLSVPILALAEIRLKQHLESAD